MSDSHVGGLYAEILDYPYWRHRIPLGDGNFTPGTKSPRHWETLDLPERVDGKSVLTVGAWDGLHAFEAERRGADRVLATDIWELDKEDRGLPQEQNSYLDIRDGKRGFELVKEYRQSAVQSKRIDVYDIDPDSVGTFDIVICSGVLYHLRYPMLAVDNLAAVTDELLVIESKVANDSLDEPVLHATPNDDLSDSAPYDQHFQWTPNVDCLESMAQGTNATEIRTFLTYRSGQRSPDEPLGGSQDTPPVRDAVTTAPAQVYADHELEKPVSVLPYDLGEDGVLSEGTSVTVIYGETEHATRIQSGLFQGWVPTDVVGSATGASSPLRRRALSKIRDDGWIEFIRSGLGLVHESLRKYGNSDEVMNRVVLHSRYD